MIVTRSGSGHNDGMNTVVFRWRVSSEKIAALRTEARLEGISLTRLLNKIIGEWLRKPRAPRKYDQAEQDAIRRRVMAVIGSVQGGDPTRSARTSELVSEIIQRKHK